MTILSEIYQIETRSFYGMPSTVLARAFEETRAHGFSRIGRDVYHHEGGATLVFDDEDGTRTIAGIIGREDSLSDAREKLFLACHQNNLKCERTKTEER